MNNLLLKIAFANGVDKQVNFSQKNEILPLYILHFNDSFEEIGDAKVFNQKGSDLLSLWEDSYNSIFLKEDNLNENPKEKDKDLKEFLERMKAKYEEIRLDEELVIFE